MPADSNDAEDAAVRWRALEAEARALARRMTDPEPKRIMLFIAEGYKLLRERAEFLTTQKIER
jgi:plasmid stability protein